MLSRDRSTIFDTRMTAHGGGGNVVLDMYIARILWQS